MNNEKESPVRRELAKVTSALAELRLRRLQLGEQMTRVASSKESLASHRKERRGAWRDR
jgi:hypothetical protein